VSHENGTDGTTIFVQFGDTLALERSRYFLIIGRRAPNAAFSVYEKIHIAKVLANRFLDECVTPFGDLSSEALP
jgi:hypothetical protein